MRFATLLFFAFASFCLGCTAIAAGGARVLAIIFQANEVVVNGFQTPPTEPWQSILIGATLFVTLSFLLLALYFGLKDLEGPPKRD